MKNSRNNNIISGFSIWFQLVQWIRQNISLKVPATDLKGTKFWPNWQKIQVLKKMLIAFI